MKKIFQIIDSPKRDLEWRLLLAKKLADKGITSYIGSAQNIRSKFLLEGGVLVGRLGGTSGRSKFDNLFLKEIESVKGKIFYFHDEGGAFRVNGYERESRLAYPSELCSKEVFRKVYFWGEAQSEIFKDEEWIHKGKVLGCPRFDLYAENKVNQSKKNIILINTRFSNVQTVKDDPTSLSKRMLEIRIEGGELEYRNKEQIIENMFHRWKTSSKDFVAFVEMISKVCLTFKDQEFVLRPHPAEDVQWYNTNLQLLENLKVDNVGDVKDVFSKTKLLIHSECTTGLEADLQGIPHINFIPFPQDTGEGVVGLRSIGKICYDSENVVRQVSEFLANENNFCDENSNKEREIDYYIANLNKLGTATSLLADELGEFFTEEGVKPKLNLYYALKVNAFNVLRNAKNYLKFRNVSKKNMWPSKAEVRNKWLELGGAKSSIKVGGKFIEVVGNK